MGWSYWSASHYKNGKIDKKAEMDDYWNQEERDGWPQMKVLRSSMVGSTYYAAVELSRNGEVQEVFAGVSLTSENNRDYHNFGAKNMTENEGPIKYDCPVSILKLLTPTDNETALGWRKSCEKKHEDKKRIKSLEVGDKIHVNGYDDPYVKTDIGWGKYKWVNRDNRYVPESRAVSYGYDVL